MTSETRARLLDAVHRRALALAKVTAPDMRSSTFLIVLSARNLFNTVLALCGPELAKDWLNKLFGDLLESQTVCRFCQVRDSDPDLGMCEACEQQSFCDDADVQQAVLMSQPNKGAVN